MTDRYRVTGRIVLEAQWTVDLGLRADSRHAGLPTLDDALAADRRALERDPLWFCYQAGVRPVSLEYADSAPAPEQEVLRFLFVGKGRAHIVRPGTGRERLVCNIAHGPFLPSFLFDSVPEGISVCRTCRKPFSLPERPPVEVRFDSSGAQIADGAEPVPCDAACGFMVAAGSTIHPSCARSQEEEDGAQEPGGRGPAQAEKAQGRAEGEAP